MKFDEITAGLEKLLEANHYNPATIRFYKNEWRKIRRFLSEKYSDSAFDMERGLAYLEEKYHLQTKYNDGTLSQQRVQLLRVVHMLEDYRLHKALTRRFHASKNPIQLKPSFNALLEDYTLYLQNSSLSKSTVGHYTATAKIFLDYLGQRMVASIEDMNMEYCHGFFNTLAGYSFKTVEQRVCGLRHFLRFLNASGYSAQDFASEIHMPNISKSTKIPSAWTADELTRMIHAIDRNSPTGKRDYAMILLACVLGVRIGDIKNLRFKNFDWYRKQLSFVQHKTQKPVNLPLPDAVGWAIIDYVKNGRPDFDETDFVFIKHMPPFDPFSDNNHMQQQIVGYMNKAGIRKDKNKRAGFHSLRHSAGSMLLDMETPLPVITSILGHSDIDVTGIYLKTDLQKLRECVLPVEVTAHE